MKRIGTVLFSFIVLASFALNAGAQVLYPASNKAFSAPRVTTSKASSTTTAAPSSPVLSTPASKGAEPQTIRTDAVSYFQDTTGGNWWAYAPVLNQSTGDSLGYFQIVNGWFYLQNEDTIGPIQVGGPGKSIDTTPYDTMYNRVMALRVTPPTDISSPRIDSVSITFYAEAFNPTDLIQFWVVPITDAPFQDGSTHPIPDLFGTSIAKGTIKASAITVGQLNTITVPLGHKPLSGADNKNEIGICVFVDGPNFTTDTIGYQMDANLQTQLGTGLVIDTDGSLPNTPQGPSGGIPMRTYRESLDAGNLTLWNVGQSQSQGTRQTIGGGGGFFVDNTEIDQTGTPTGNAFEGNLVLITYFSGTALGVDESSSLSYSLDQNYPNPVSTTAEINYNLAVSGPVTLKVYNALGEEVETVMNSSIQGAGQHSATFNAGTLPDGMYYYKLQSGEFTATHSLVIAR